MEFQWFWMSASTILAIFFYIFVRKVVRNLNEWYYDLKFRNKQFPLPPGDMGWPLIGNLWPFFKYFSSGRRDIFINNIILRYGRSGIYKTHLYGSPSIIVTAPAMCKKVLNDEVTFKLGYPKAVTVLAYNRVLNNEHGRLKRLVTAPIAGNNVSTMYLGRIEDIVINKLEELSSMKHPVEFLKEMRKISFNFIFQIFTGYCDQGTINKISDLFDVMGSALFSLMPINVPGFAFNKALKARKKFAKIVQNIIDERRMMAKDRQIGEKKDLISILLEMNDEAGEKLEDKDIIDLLITLLFGGHDSIAAGMMLTIMYLTEHPLCLKKAKEEQEEILKARPPSQKRLSIEEIQKMTYLSQVFDETLRITSVFATFREATTDANINGYLIPKGWKVLVWLNAMHMDPEHHSNPEEFNPSRWNDHNPTTGTFLPFGIGRRLCPGRDLSKYEMLIFLHYFVLNYKLERINPECPLTSLPYIKPTDNCLAKVTKLSDA